MKRKVVIDYSKNEAAVELPGVGRVTGLLMHDEVDPPWEEWDGEGKVDLFERGRCEVNGERVDAATYFERKFHSPQEEVVQRLVSGQVVNDREGNPCLGFEAYIHSGEVWYLPGGCQVDRQWDVAALRGIWTADKYVLANIGDGSVTAARLRDYLKGCLSTWNMYLSGDAWIVSAMFEDLDGNKEEGDCVGGLYGEEGIKDFMEEQARMFLRSQTSSLEEQVAILEARCKQCQKLLDE